MSLGSRLLPLRAGRVLGRAAWAHFAAAAAIATVACLGLAMAGTTPRPNKRPSSPAVEAALHVKRLAQLKRAGGSYQDYLIELRRLSPEDGAKSQEEMRSVIQYKEDEERLVEQLQRKRICFLPDCSVYPERRWFYPQLYRPERLSAAATFTVESFFDMPNVFEFMTKRYEVQWLTHMRSLRPSLAEFDCVIAHGTSAEAVLRYLESDALKSCVLVDASDVYTAGERHGRTFHLSTIAKHCHHISLLGTGPDDQAAATSLASQLSSHSPLDYNTDCDCDPGREEIGDMSKAQLSTPRLLARVSAEVAKLVRGPAGQHV